MEDAAEADFLGFAGDREIHCANAEELEREHPVAKVVKEKGEVVVVLERLNLHARHRLHVVLRHLVVETRDLVLHEAGQFHVERRVALADAFDDALQVVLIQFREFREAIVGQQVGEFLRLARVVLKIDRHLLRAHEQRGLEAAVAPHDQPAAFAHRDRPAPALVLNDRREKLDLMRAVPVRINRVRLERRRIDEGIVGAVDLHDDRRVSKRPALTGLRNLLKRDSVEAYPIIGIFGGFVLKKTT
jgi:hypothetical protein